ncbi:hypothetical protein V2O64_19960 [Verrucomicrobiaceae bacterium 227]
MMVRLILGVLLAGWLCSCSQQQSQARLTDPVLPAKGGDPDIFRLYSRVGDSKLKAGWASGMDMSGVSFDERMTATLVSRRHVVMANHFQRKVGMKVVFHDRQGKYLERYLVQVSGVAGDVAVGLLDRPVPGGYRVYPLPASSTVPEALVGRPVVVSDQNRRLFFHKVRRVGGGGISFEFDREDKHGWGKSLVSGDSGNPSFLIVGRELVLVETHTTGGPGAGPYYGNAGVQEKLKAVMARMDPAYTFRTVRVN